MIICCYTDISRQWNEQELTDKLLLLPAGLQQAALRKRQWLNRQQSIAGKLLLNEVLKELGTKDVLLKDLAYNTHLRPYFNENIDFNISHSGNIVVCCGTAQGKIGIDVELVKKIDLTDYPDYFTANEWDYIHSFTPGYDGFYNLWTRKEAILKAIGTGFHTPLSSIDVVADEVEYDGILYHILPINIAQGYKCHVAATVPSQETNAININL